MPKNLLLSTLDKRNGSIGCYYLPKGLLKLDIQWTTDEYGRRSLAFAADVTLVPDPAFRYYLSYVPSWLSSDKVNVAYTPEGFLSSITTEQTDETLNVVSTVIQSIGSVLTGAPLAANTRDINDTAPESPVIYKGYIDPLDNLKVELLNQALAKHKLYFTVSPVSGDVSSVDKISVESTGSGVFYRPFETYNIAIASSNANVPMSDEYLISLPSATSVHLAKIPMASFVHNTFNMTFQNGVPQSVAVDKPSSALAVAKVPFEIIQAIIALPAQLFQFRINLQREHAINTENYADALLNAKLAEKKRADLEKRIAQGRPLTGGGGSSALPTAQPVAVQPIAAVAIQPATELPAATYLPSTPAPETNLPVSPEEADAAANDPNYMPPVTNF
jgi:hypothetical protein